MMANDLSKVLIIASLEDSRTAAFKMEIQFKEAGYSVDFAVAKDEPENEDVPAEEPDTNIKYNTYMSKHMDLVQYKGIIFIDDGGDLGIAKVLAKRAAESNMPIGGYRQGCLILAAAKVLKDKFIPSGLPEEMQKGNKIVNSPVVRSDNFVLASGHCATGFVFLMLDALGGIVQRTVESKKQKTAVKIPHSAFVLSSMGKWSDYWTLAEKLASRNRILILADWQDINLGDRTIERFLVIGPQVKEKVAYFQRPVHLPEKIWVKEPSIKTADLNQAKQILKTIGCAAVDSLETDTEEYKILLREMGHNGIWVQPSGMLAVQELDRIDTIPTASALRRAIADCSYYLAKFKEAHNNNEYKKAALFSRIVRRNVLRVRLIKEYQYYEKQKHLAESNGLVKTADYAFDQQNSGDYEYNNGTVAGPYSNVQVPDRVIPWHEGDDFLEDLNGMDEQAIANLSRYHPDTKDGFYAEFDLWHENDPESWDDVEKGQGNYPSRSLLR